MKAYLEKHTEITRLRIQGYYDAKDKPAYAEIGPRLNYTFAEAFDRSASNFWFITRETVKLPGYIFNAQKRKQISGIVGVSVD